MLGIYHFEEVLKPNKDKPMELQNVMSGSSYDRRRGTGATLQIKIMEVNRSDVNIYVRS